jgi:hypothetical protein
VADAEVVLLVDRVKLIDLGLRELDEVEVVGDARRGDGLSERISK